MSDYDVLNKKDDEILNEDYALAHSQNRLMEEASLLPSEVNSNAVSYSSQNKGAIVLAKTMLPVFQRMIAQLLHAYFNTICEQYLKPLDKIEPQVNELRAMINDDMVSLSRKMLAFRTLIDSLDTGWSDDVSATLTAFDGLSLKISTALRPEDIPAMLDTFINVLSLKSIMSHVDKDFLSYWREHLVSLKQHIEWSVRIYTAPRNNINDYLNLIFDSALLPEWAAEFIHQVQDVYGYLQQWVAELGEGELPETLAWIKGYTQAYFSAGSPGERMKVMFHMLQHEEVMQIIYPLIRQKIPLIADAFQTLDSFKLEASEIDQAHGSVATSLDYFLRVTDDNFTQKLMQGSENSAGENTLHIGREVGAILRQAGQYTQAGSYSGMLFKNMLKVMQSDMGWMDFVKACASETPWWDLTVSLFKTGIDYSLGAFVAAINIVNLGWNSEFVATWGSMTWRQLPAAALKNLSDELNKKDSALLREVERFPLLGGVIKTLMLLLNDLSNKDNWLEILISRLSEYIRDVPLIRMLDKLIKVGLMWQLWQVSRLQGATSSLEEKKQAIQQAQSTLYTYMQYFPEQDLKMLQPMISWLPMIRTAWDLSVGVPQVEDHSSLLHWGAELLSNVESQAGHHPTPAVVALQHEMAVGFTPVIDIALGAGTETVLADKVEEPAQQAGVTNGFLQQQREKIAQLSELDVTKWLNKEDIGNFASSTLRMGKNNAVSALRKFNTLGTIRVSSVRKSVMGYFANKQKTDDLTLQGFEEISLDDDVTEPAELRSVVQTFMPSAVSAWKNISQYTRGQGQDVYQRWQNMSSTKKNAIKGVAIGSAVIAGGAGLYALLRHQEHVQTLPEFEHPAEKEAYRNQLIEQLAGIEKRRKIAKGVSLGSGILSLLMAGMGAGIRAGKIYDAYRHGKIPEDELSATSPDLVGREAEQAVAAQHEIPQGILSRLKTTLNDNERIFWSVGAGLLLPATVGGYYWWRYAQQEKNLRSQLELLDEKEEGSGSELLALTAEKLLETLGDAAATASPEQIRTAMMQSDTENNKDMDTAFDIQNDGIPDYARNVNIAPQESLFGSNAFESGSINNFLAVIRRKEKEREQSRIAEEEKARQERLAEENRSRERDWQSMSTEEILRIIGGVSYEQRCKAYDELSNRQGISRAIKLKLIEIGMVYDPVLNQGSLRAEELKAFKKYRSWGLDGQKVVGVLRDARRGERSFPEGRKFYLEIKTRDGVVFNRNYLPTGSLDANIWHADISRQINDDMKTLPKLNQIKIKSIHYASYNKIQPVIVDEIAPSWCRNVFIAENSSPVTDATWRLDKMPELMSKEDAESDFPTDKVFLIAVYDSTGSFMYKKGFIPQKYRENPSYSDTERARKRAETLKKSNWKTDIIEQFQEDCKDDSRFEGLSFHRVGDKVLYFLKDNHSISRIEGEFVPVMSAREIFSPHEVKAWINDNAPEVSLDSLITVTQYSDDKKEWVNKYFPIAVALSPGFNSLNLVSPSKDQPEKIVNWDTDANGWVMQNYSSGMTEEDFELVKSFNKSEIRKRGIPAFDETMKNVDKDSDAIAMLDAKTWLDKQIIETIRNYGVPDEVKIDLEEMVHFKMKSQEKNILGMATAAPLLREENLSLRETILKKVVLAGVIASDKYAKNHILSTSWPDYLQSRQKLRDQLEGINFESRYEKSKEALSDKESSFQHAIIKNQVDKALARAKNIPEIDINDNPEVRFIYRWSRMVNGVFVVPCRHKQRGEIAAILSVEPSMSPYLINWESIELLRHSIHFNNWLHPNLSLGDQGSDFSIILLDPKKYSLAEAYDKLLEFKLRTVSEDIKALVKTTTEVYIDFFKNMGGQLLQFLALPLTVFGLAGVPYITVTGLAAFAVLGLVPTMISYIAADTQAEKNALGQELLAMVVAELFGLFLARITAPILKSIGNQLSTSLKRMKELVIDLQQRADRKLYSKLINPGEEVTERLAGPAANKRLTNTQKGILNGINESLGENTKLPASVDVSNVEHGANLLTGSYDYKFKSHFQALVQEILKEDEEN